MMSMWFAFLLAAPTILVMLAARLYVSRALGMKGVRFFFGGAIENAEAAQPGKRAAVVLAGLVSSYLVAGVLFAVALLFGGKPGAPSTVVDPIPDRPAAVAGMKARDRVVSVASAPVATWDELAKAIARRSGEPTEIVVARGAEEVRLTVTPEGEPGKGKIGIQTVMTRVPAGALDVAEGLFVTPARVLVNQARGLWSVAAGTGTAEVAGPVEVVRESARAADRGPADSLTFLAALLAYTWPLTALLAVAFVPRRARAKRG